MGDAATAAARRIGSCPAILALAIGLALLSGALLLRQELGGVATAGGGVTMSRPLEFVVDRLAVPLAQWWAGSAAGPAQFVGMTRNVLWAGMLAGLLLVGLGVWTLARGQGRGP